MKILLVYLAGCLTPLVVAIAVAASGLVDMSADRPPGAAEALVGGMLSDRSVEHRAPSTRNPLPASPEVLRAGLAHFREDCLVCHGAPGVPRGEIGRGLNPPAPELATPDTQEASDGELFQVVAHGIRMTGMPAWLPSVPEREVWETIAFVRHLPALSDAERRTLMGASQQGAASSRP